MSNEINITLFHPPTSKTDAISIPPTTTLADLSNFAQALLGLDGGAVLAKQQSRQVIYNPAGGDGSKTLAQSGVVDGDFISVYTVGEFENVSRASPARQRQRTAPPPPAAAAASGGGLDFSALLGGGGAAPTRPAPAGAAAGGMDFTALLSVGQMAAASSATSAPSAPVQWDGMNLDDVMDRNANPVHIVTILSDTTRHPHIMKELNYRSPQVVKQLQSANGDISKMAEVWRQTMMKSNTARYFQIHQAKSKESEMRRKLEINPMDEEANKYFGEKIKRENVWRQYEQMMEEYPESMGKVLMLYINCTVNKRPLQVFVDSGAQMTIMSSQCAERLDLLHLVDERFQGVAVGVGQGKILGKIHLVDLEIGGYAFTCSITVMDSDKGLGDKNMDCLFGLDMLKRHRCNIDLAKNVLRFAIGATGESMEAPFLHEKDLPTSKGGTMDFDAERENAEVEAMMQKMDEDDGEKMDEDDGGKKEEGEEKKSGDAGEGK